MTHRFPLKEIARQAGLGTATVDRVLNNRAHVSPQTKARVSAAISELEGQETQLSARGRRMFFDFVIEAPARFSKEVQTAAQHVAPQIGLAVCRPRFLMQEIMTDSDVLRALERISKRGSHGICLKTRDLPAIRSAVDDVVAAGIPIVTLVTDISASDRNAYIGLDNHSAGRTAAYLMAQGLKHESGTVLTTRSNTRFLGEEEREAAFTQALRRTCPNLHIVDVSGGSGVPSQTAQLLTQAIDQLQDLRAVYSMGGGNQTILNILDDHNLHPDLFIAHDLDRENRALIEAGRINYILHHDLRADLQNVFLAFLGHHKLTREHPALTPSHVQVLTPENIPPQDRPF
jgi:LacI family transcriptional regulator